MPSVFGRYGWGGNTSQIAGGTICSLLKDVKYSIRLNSQNRLMSERRFYLTPLSRKLVIKDLLPSGFRFPLKLKSRPKAFVAYLIQNIAHQRAQKYFKHNIKWKIGLNKMNILILLLIITCINIELAFIACQNSVIIRLHNTETSGNVQKVRSFHQNSSDEDMEIKRLDVGVGHSVLQACFAFQYSHS